VNIYKKDDKVSEELVIDKMQDLKEVIENTREETITSVLKTIKINDSYFYAKMVIMEMSLIEDPFGNNVKVIMEINLVKSEDFNNENIVISNKVAYPKKIRSELVLEKELVNQKEDLMMIVYDEVSKEIAKDLFQSNARDIKMSLTDRKNFI